MRKKILPFLGSLKLSFLLLAIIIVLVAERAIIAQKLLPQESEPSWFLDFLHRLAPASPESLDLPFGAVLFLFVVNLTLASPGMLARIRGKRQAGIRFREAESIRTLDTWLELSGVTGAWERLRKGLQGMGLTPQVETITPELLRFHAGRRASGRWGVFFFHAAFFVILVGALLSYATRFSGYVELAPGEKFVENPKYYRFSTAAPLLFAGGRGFSLQLIELGHSYWRPGKAKERTSTFAVSDSSGNPAGERQLAVNSPFRMADMQVYQGQSAGFRARLAVSDATGTTAEGIIHFPFPKESGKPPQTQARLPGTDLTLFFELFTDQFQNVPGLETLALRHRMSLLKVYSAEQGVTRFHGVVFEGSRLTVHDLSLEFRRLDPYTSVVLVRDYGVPVIFAGFACLLASLLVTYFWVPESYWGEVRRHEAVETILIGASTEKYKESFRERFLEQMRHFEEDLGRP